MSGGLTPGAPQQGRWKPGAGWERLRREAPHLVPAEISEEDLRRADEIIAAGRAADLRSPKGRQRWLRHVPSTPRLLPAVLFLIALGDTVAAAIQIVLVIRSDAVVSVSDLAVPALLLLIAAVAGSASVGIDMARSREARRRYVPGGHLAGPRAGVVRAGYRAVRAAGTGDWSEVTAVDLKVGDSIQMEGNWRVVSAKGPAPDNPILTAIWAGTVEPIVCLPRTVFMAQTADMRRAAAERWLTATDRLADPSGR